MGANSFNAMELDAIGEIMNISLGASATAISTLLGTKVNITTPVAQVLSSDEFSFKRMEPAVGVDISYVKGLEGSNVMIFRRNDVRVIVGILMGAEIPEEEFVMDDEINVSAVCEVMNQMMGSSATALSEFLGYPVDISTPKSFEITDDLSFKERYFPAGTEQVLVRFTLEIGDDVLKSEFMNIMSIDLIKRLLAPFADSFQSMDVGETAPVAEPENSIIQTGVQSDGVMSQEEIQAMMSGNTETAEPAGGDAKLSQEEIQAMMSGAAGTAEPAGGDEKLSQEEIQDMMSGAAGTAEPAGG
ncbi:MAG: flagellar motor switch protein FliN, partial [Lachnospiraceae bacterium]|nr:flagellar motor switch protein FliN [Lachnospiraceae bacterium]